MHYIVYAHDIENGLSLRMDNREAHIAFLKAKSDVAVKIAGPILDETQTQMIGSLLIVEAQSLTAVEKWCDSDPYAKAGLTAARDIRPYNWVIGKPAG